VTPVEKIVARFFGSQNGELCVGGLPVSRIAERHGTPLFVYAEAVLEQKLAALRATLPDRFSIHYSIKANPAQAIVQFFVARGCGLEIASAGEFHQARAAGCPAQRIIFAGPGKTEAELETVLRAEIGEIHCESMLELQRIGAISRRLGVRARVALRVNPGEEAQGGAMRMGGKPVAFGIDEEALDSVLDRLLSDPHVDWHGIHLFAGTQILDWTVLVAQYRKGIEIARRAAARAGRSPRTVDFGGGLGIPYYAGDQELDLDGLKRGLEALMAEIPSDSTFESTRFVLEPGRFLVGEAGIYVARIQDIKLSRGKKFLIADGGMNHHLAASGNLGQTIKRNFPIAILNKVDAPAEETVEVVGPLCTPLDVLGRSVNLPSAAVGDLVGIFQSGAYARAASPLGFLSHPTPPEVLVRQGEACLIRRRGELDDYVRDVVSPVPVRAGCAS
jgi:diaminopimelate decarboxylase